MRLDHTRITIRERGFADILDLALRVTRAHALPMVVLTALGVAPWIVVNHWLLADLSPYLLATDLPGEERLGAFLGFGFVYVLLVMVEAPLATAPLTLYLGQTLFFDQLDRRRLARDFLRSLPQLIFVDVVPRALLLPWVVTWFLPFVFWPYLGEIILLERNPLWRRKQTGTTTTLSRAMTLHGYSTGDLFVRWLSVVFLAPLLVIALWLGTWSVRCILVEDWAFAATAFTLFLPLSTWCIVGLMAVVRFLSYLDQRIRSEGWEIELMMRAEAVRLTGQIA